MLLLDKWLTDDDLQSCQPSAMKLSTPAVTDSKGQTTIFCHVIARFARHGNVIFSMNRIILSKFAWNICDRYVMPPHTKQSAKLHSLADKLPMWDLETMQLYVIVTNPTQMADIPSLRNIHRAIISHAAANGNTVEVYTGVKRYEESIIILRRDKSGWDCPPTVLHKDVKARLEINRAKLCENGLNIRWQYCLDASFACTTLPDLAILISKYITILFPPMDRPFPIGHFAAI